MRIVQLIDTDPIGLFEVEDSITDEMIKIWYKEYDNSDGFEDFEDFLTSIVTCHLHIKKVFVEDINV